MIKAALRRHLSLPTTMVLARANKRAMIHFAETVGMVYFGHIDTHSEEHQLVRGLTLSTRHRDRHYTVGSLYGYDIAYLQRTDTLHFPGKSPSDHSWVVMQFDLHTKRDIPHLYIGLHTHSEAFYSTLLAKFSRMQRLALTETSRVFTDRYVVYGAYESTSDIENLLDAETTRLIASHFGTLTFEIVDRCLYVYSEHRRITSSLLDTMLKNGVWLARHIDGYESSS